MVDLYIRVCVTPKKTVLYKIYQLVTSTIIVITSRGRSVKRGRVIVHVRMSVCLFVCLSVFKTRLT